ncbi:sugar phosphate isomerase/epimerase [Paraglaciecola sp. L3A3]|uniref:sugar phosphate isomerase/epimerase family protein n=1 Tax=Paraglaciecola sp. L3A3 TaxID=2686358 RepID=UPI0018EEFE26|nr:TIM barrel protein [Paraglaciecola sp. L3A3]
MKRRQFIQSSAALGLTGILSASSGLHSKVLVGESHSHNNDLSDLDINIFSKHLQFLDYADMADAAANIGFNGVDLTVRPKGHVLPERVEHDLPKAVEAMSKVGFTPNMMTTAITDTQQNFTAQILNTAGELGFNYYRMGYYRFPEDIEAPQALDDFNQKCQQLAELNKQSEIKGAYQNHAGAGYVGAQIWDIWHLLEGIDSDYLGCQYDIRHASVEGAKSWPIPFNMLRQKINSIVLKDYQWQQVNGQWKLKNVPIGQGMVDFNSYFSLLKKLKIHVPVSLHFEYELGGAEHGAKNIKAEQSTVFNAMKRDVNTVRKLWEMA